MRHRRSLVLTTNTLCLVLALVWTSTASAVGPPTAEPSGYRVLHGRAAATFRVPADVDLLSTWRDHRAGLTYERYQQVKQPFDAHVEGGQLTVVRRGGVQELVIGAHYPSLTPTNRVLVDGTQAVGKAVGGAGVRTVPELARQGLQHRVDLRIDPVTGRLFQRVESFAEGVQVFTRVDAETGEVLASWNALPDANGMGTGVHGDRKTLLGADPSDPADDLTSKINGVWVLRSRDNRVSTYDARRDNRYYSGIGLLNDNRKISWANDNDWKARYQRSGVDAQYYAALSDDWYLDDANVGGFDHVNTLCEPASPKTAPVPLGPIRTVVHFDQYPGDGVGYDNAFWDGAAGGHLVFGDGDGRVTGPFSGSQDVVSHELTHAVTQCRSLGLSNNYFGQPGALNEALSDMMATAMEWSFNEPLTTNCRRQTGQAECRDWWIGEDAMLGAQFGFRSLSDPPSADQPSHWQDRADPNSGYDNGGVHVNSTIASHAFYLAANGGRNARCSGPTDSQKDCDVAVPAIGVHDAARLFFAAWQGLTETATFCEAHDATVAAAELLYPGSVLHRAAADLAWTAVGRGSQACSSNGWLAVATPRGITVAPGGTGMLTVTTTRNAVITASGLNGFNFTVTPSGTGATVRVTAAAGVGDGTYPISISANDGTTTRYASAAIVVDASPPVVGIGSVGFATSGQVSPGGAVPLTIGWSAHDGGSGLAESHLQSKATTASDFVNVASGAGPSNLSGTAPGYSLRVAATDGVGNAAVSEAGAPWMIGRYQEDSATYHGTWSGMAATTAWDSVRYSKTQNAWLSFNFTGTAVAWISTRGPNRGKAKVYVDDVFAKKVDLYASTASARRVAFTTSGLSPGSHKLTIVVLGTSSRPRVDVDGFATLSQ